MKRWVPSLGATAAHGGNRSPRVSPAWGGLSRDATHKFRAAGIGDPAMWVDAIWQRTSR